MPLSWLLETVTFAARAPSKKGVVRVYLAPCDKDKQGLPWNSNKVVASLKFGSTGDEWSRGTMYSLTSPKAVWGRLRVDVGTPEVYLDDIVVRRRFVPESGPVRVEIGPPETKP